METFEKMDIDKEMETLVIKYGIDKHNPEFQTYVKVKEKIRELWKQLNNAYNNIVVVSYKQIDVDCFFESLQQRYEQRSYKVVNLEIPSNNRIAEAVNEKSIYLVISHYYKDELMMKLLDEGVRAVSLEDFLESESVYLCHDYYDIYTNGYFNMVDGSISYEYHKLDIDRIFFYHRRRYETAVNDRIKKIYLEKMIFDTVYNRDFVMLEDLIEKYKAEFEVYASNYINFYKEVNKLIDRIKGFMFRYRANDCVMFWIDALEYGMDQNMPFLKGIDQDALVFENMYTETPYTTSTLRMLLQKKKRYEEGMVNESRIDEKSHLIKKLKERDYEFEYYGGKAVSRELRANYSARQYEDFSRICWFYLKERMLDCKGSKKWVIMHEFYATHPPFISMGLKGMKYEVVNFRPVAVHQREESKVYIDKILKFYSDILPDNCLKIYMSDHGTSFFGKFHVIFKIQKKGILSQRRKELLSYKQFEEILLPIIDDKLIDLKKIEREYVEVIDIDYQAKIGIQRKIKRSTINPKGVLAYNGIITKDDMLLVYRDGTELYQKHVNDEKMVTDERLDWLRSRNSKDYVNTKNHLGFTYANVYLDGFENCRRRTKVKIDKKIGTIKSIFENISSGQQVLLAEGGVESLHMLMLLDEKQRRKITYILDENKDCEAGKLGIKVIGAEDVKNYKIDMAIILSFYNRQALKNTLTVKGIPCIDVYEEMKKNGADCTKAFYELEYIPSDFDMRAFDEDAFALVVIKDAKEFASAWDKLILYGTGLDSEIIYDAIENKDIIFCDQKAENGEYEFKGKRVIAPETLFREYKDYAVLVTTSLFAGEIYGELIKNGIDSEKIWCNKMVLCEYMGK